MSLHLYDRIRAIKENRPSGKVSLFTLSVCKCILKTRVKSDAEKRTCLSFMWVSLSLLTATSHTHTTVLVPAVTTVVGLGEAAHSVSPQSHKLSQTAKVYRQTTHRQTIMYNEADTTYFKY